MRSLLLVLVLPDSAIGVPTVDQCLSALRDRIISECAKVRTS